LVYFMESSRRMTLEEISERHSELLSALCEHLHVGFVLVRLVAEGAVAIGARGTHRLADGAVTGDDPLAGFSPNAGRHLLRSDGFDHVADIMVNSFYDPAGEEGCAFEELISFHGGMGGPQTRPFILHPVSLEVPAEPLIGAEAVHRLLCNWRDGLHHRHSDADALAPASGARDTRPAIT